MRRSPLKGLPKNRLTLILPMEYADLENPPDIAGDASDWKFFINRQALRRGLRLADVP